MNIRERIAENQKTRKRSWLVSWLVPPMVSSEIQPIEWAKFSLVYLQAGNWTEAEKLQTQVKELACERLGLDHPKTIDIMQLLSVTYGLQTCNNKAASLLRQALDACTRFYGPDHVKTLKMADTLGGTCLVQSRFSEARRLHERAVKGMTEVLGAEHEDTLVATDNLGKVMSRYFFYDKAREKKVGKEHPYTLMAKLTLARIKCARNETDEAETIIRDGLPVGVRNLGDNHLGVLLARTWLSQVLMRQQRYREAEEILTTVIQRHRYEGSRREDGEHVDRIQALWFLLKCYQSQGKIEEAILIGDELWEAVQTIGGEGLGTQHLFYKHLAEKREELLAVKQGSNAELIAAPYDPVSPGSGSTGAGSPGSIARSLTF